MYAYKLPLPSVKRGRAAEAEDKEELFIYTREPSSSSLKKSALTSHILHAVDNTG